MYSSTYCAGGKSVSEIFNILSVDGGGIRGVFPAQILSLLEKKMKIKLENQFDMLAGTSTGAIIVAAIASRVPMSDVVELYVKNGKEIFKKKAPGFLSFDILWRSKYRKNYLHDLLNEFFKNKRLGEIHKPLILPATNIGNGTVHVFKSNYLPNYVRDGDVLLAEAVLASCSAPTFFDPTHVGNFLLADGGLWANNPGLLAVIDSINRCGKNNSDLFLLSLGTGERKNMYGVNANRKWGFLTGWRKSEFIELILSLQSQSAQNYLENIIKKDQVIRMNYIQQTEVKLDDTSSINDLLSYADDVFAQKSALLKDKFIGKEGTVIF